MVRALPVLGRGLLSACCLMGWAGALSASEVLVSSASEIAAALPLLQAGDVLVMQDGVWNNQRIDFAARGTEAAPITLRSQTPGGVKLTGSSKLTISGDWLIVDGLRFENGSLGAGEHVVRFQGPLGEATNSRFTNSAIVDYNPTDIGTRYFWVSLEGQNNRVDHNYFSGQSHSGVTVTVWRDSSAADHHRIDSNHFADRPAGNGNGFETIRVGTSTFSESNSLTVVENNLFERVDGEIEIISSKSGENVYRYNTFRESAGTLTLRHGNDSTVQGNFFLGEGKDASGGVRVIGERQTVINNYFHGLDGRADGAISISAGVVDSELSGYVQVRDAVIAHNTIVDVNRAAISFDNGLGSSGRTLLAEGVTVAANLIHSTQDPLFEGAEGAGWTWQDNIAFGQSLGPKAGGEGIAVVDPLLTVGQDGLYRLSAGSPAIDAAAALGGLLVGDDFEGQPRIGVADIGGDEFSSLSLSRKPLVAGDVGPVWLSAPSGPSEGACSGGDCLLQAEAYSQLLDPDGDGATWERILAGDALGGQAIKATSGDRVDLGSEAHDAIVAYDIEFDTAGVYTAYYRARGFSSATDSIFSPDSLGSDPDNTETLESGGVFDWRQGQATFTVGSSDLGVPLELRLGMRERDAEIDAIVLSLNAGLSDAELDELFAATASVPGDYNGDGVVNAADYTVWRDGLNPIADGDGNGAIDVGDYAFWSARFEAGITVGAAGTVPEPVLWPLGLAFATVNECARMRRSRGVRVVVS
ncbi:MAG: chondroitinase-B domain-containing protein [Planctomycetota bacterium]